MTNSNAKTILLLALAGLLIGSMLGLLAAGAYATWVRGGDLSNIGFGTIFAFLPVSWQYITEPFRTSAMIGGGVALAGAVLFPIAGMQKALTSHGSARWATEAEMKRAKLLSNIEKLNGPIFGKLGSPKSRAAYLTSISIPHSLIAAPTGVGKGVSVVTPTLLTFPGSIVCLDMKGANYENTARHRLRMGDRVYKFAPYDPDGRTHRFNPMDAIVATEERRRFTEARRLAASFITVKGESAQGFLDGARDIFAATALLVIQRGTPTIAAIHDALSGEGKTSAAFYKMGFEVRSKSARMIFNKFASRDDKHLSAYMSILSDGGLGLWADPMVRDATATSDFKLGTLRSKPASIFLVIPPNDIEPLAPLVRLIFQQTVAILQRTLPDRKKGEKYPVLMLLDEFVSLGRMDNLKTAITTLREYNVRVMLVVQTISSLRDLYGKDGAGTFISNCGVQLFMGPADEETPDYISKAIGDYTRKSRSKSWKGGELTTSYSERTESARLIRPEQVRLLGETQVVLLVQNMLPILAQRVIYYEDRKLKKIFGSQTGAYPEPPMIEPFDPEDSDPGEGPSPSGLDGVFQDDPNDRPIEGKAVKPAATPARAAEPAAPASPVDGNTPVAAKTDASENDKDEAIKPAATPAQAAEPAAPVSPVDDNTPAVAKTDASENDKDEAVEPEAKPAENATTTQKIKTSGSKTEVVSEMVGTDVSQADGIDREEWIKAITRRSTECDEIQAELKSVRRRQAQNLQKHLIRKTTSEEPKKSKKIIDAAQQPVDAGQPSDLDKVRTQIAKTRIYNMHRAQNRQPPNQPPA